MDEGLTLGSKQLNTVANIKTTRDQVIQFRWIAIHCNTSLTVGPGVGMNGYWEILFWAAVQGQIGRNIVWLTVHFHCSSSADGTPVWGSLLAEDNDRRANSLIDTHNDDSTQSTSTTHRQQRPNYRSTTQHNNTISLTKGQSTSPSYNEDSSTSTTQLYLQSRRHRVIVKDSINPVQHSHSLILSSISSIVVSCVSLRSVYTIAAERRR